jgi:predicted PurR-regulated permease PerM
VDTKCDGPPGDPGQESPFQRRLTIVTLSLLLVFLIIYLLREFASILQPILIAMFIGYAVLPVHRWLVGRGIRSMLAYVVIFVLIVGAMLLFGRLAYSSLEQLAYRMPQYERKLDGLLEETRAYFPEEIQGRDPWTVRSLLFLELSGERLKELMQGMLGNFLGFAAVLGVVAAYLLFLGMEKASFPRKIRDAFSPARAEQVLLVIDSINQAIGQYLAVKAFISLVGGALTTLVLWCFGVDFYVMWGILAFLLNFIPYVGTLVAVALPIMLSLVQFDTVVPAIFIAILLAIVHQSLALIEPRLAGSRLDVSPFLILLALAFWGYIWGIIGMILAVPLLVTGKIVLENIPETKPIARLISHM